MTGMSTTVEARRSRDTLLVVKVRTGARAAASDEDDLPVKEMLAGKINTLIGERGLSQVQAAGLLRMSQPKISAIRNQKLQGISLQRLMLALTALGQQVEITVRPSSGHDNHRISVSA